ncbi:MAG: hypothetical protein C4305_06495 [Thermoleophilia bacterium]
MVARDAGCGDGGDERDLAAPHDEEDLPADVQAIYAFQKAQDLPRSGIADRAFWERLESPRPPRPRFLDPVSHLEIDRTSPSKLVLGAGAA